MASHLRGDGIFRLGSASSLSRCRPETEPSSGASPSAATVTYACSSCRQPGLFCCGQRIGLSMASGPGSLAPLSACIRTFWPRPLPTSWRGSPGQCWHKNAPMNRASRRQQPEMKTLRFTKGITAAHVAPSPAGLGITLCFSMAMLERAGAAEPAANVDANRIAAPDPANWPSYGRTYSEQRFSPLSRINADNAPRLGLAWYADLDSDRGQEATPLVIDGVL